jgi:hypothetical protein
MAIPPTAAAGKAIVAKQLAQREAMWPGISGSPWLWHRQANKGFATIPKTMPLILQIMDDLSNGKPLSSTYLALWCDTWDNSMVNLSKPQEMAHAAGFTGQRALYTWRTRMLLLKELLFIDIKPGKSGDMSHVLIWNPHQIIRLHQQRKTPGLTEGAFNALLERALDIGAKDMVEPLPVILTAAEPVVGGAASAEAQKPAEETSAAAKEPTA